MKLIIPLLALITVTGCSSRPSDIDVAKSLDLELKKRCEFASVTKAKIINSASPNSNNQNMSMVKFAAVVNVKITGPLKFQWDNLEKAESIYSRWQREVAELSKNLSVESDAIQAEIEQVRKALYDWEVQNQRSAPPETVMARNHKTEELKNQLRARWKEETVQKNALQAKYAREAGTLLHTKEGAASIHMPNSFYPPEAPKIPRECTGSGDPTVALGIVYLQSVNSPSNGKDYFSDKGASAEMESERVMTKTDNGWRFSGQL